MDNPGMMSCGVDEGMIFWQAVLVMMCFSVMQVVTILEGGTGDDWLDAGRGRGDRLNGGDGADTYHLHPKGFSVIRGFDAQTDAFRVRRVSAIGDLQIVQVRRHTHVFLNETRLARFVNTDATLLTEDVYADDTVTIS